MQKTTATKQEYTPLETAQEALLKGQEAAQQAMAMGRDAVGQRVDAATTWANAYMRNQPLRALGLAAAVGAIVALLIARG